MKGKDEETILATARDFVCDPERFDMPGGVVYRSLRPDETAASVNGLLPKDGTKNAPAHHHVRNGSSSGTATQFISASMDPTIALLWAIPFQHVAVIHLGIAKRLGVENADMDALKKEMDDTAVAYAERSREILFKDSVPSPAFVVIEAVAIALSLSAPASGVSIDASEFRHLRLWNKPSSNAFKADSGANYLSHRDDPGTRLYVCIKMQRNSIVAAANERVQDRLQMESRFADVLNRGREQLRHAATQYAAGCSADAPQFVYCEADFDIHQEPVYSPHLPDVLRRLPFLLHKLDGECAHSRVEDAVRTICKLKKGDAI
jgi:hypothetical protein